jgi:hypothetical protein
MASRNAVAGDFGGNVAIMNEARNNTTGRMNNVGMVKGIKDERRGKQLLPTRGMVS